jgi:hypothetical protein
VVTEETIIDRILEAHGHVAPPSGAFTVEDYVSRAKERGGAISTERALSTLKKAMQAGELEGRQFMVNNRRRWYFWQTGQEA